jgi:murein DD-endopeptidase MepM/ murein hydrolase activator NlpD
MSVLSRRLLALVTACALLGPVVGTAAGAAALSGSTTTSSTTSSTTTTSSTVPKASSTTTSSSTTSTTATTTPGTTPATLPANTPNLAQVDPEVPSDEAELLGLIETVHSRLLDLQTQIATLNTQLASNQVTYAVASNTLAARQGDVYAADRKVDALAVDEAAARLSMRTRAVAAYIHQPTDDLATMLLHLQDPSDLVDARSFYQDLVDTQARAVKLFDALGKAAKAAVKGDTAARDAALQQQQTVAAENQVLEALKQTLQAVQSESNQQQNEQSQLLTQVGQDRAVFAAEVAAEAAQSANIEELLASLSTPGGDTASPTGGYFSFPLPGAPITSPYGPRIDPIAGYMGFHPGVDFGAPMGTPIHAAGDGVVVFAGQESGYGNYTCINHGHNIATCYGHQSQILVTVGETVTRGQIIGLVGSTGYSTGPHLHFEVRINGQVTDPMPWLTGKPTSGAGSGNGSGSGSGSG